MKTELGIFLATMRVKKKIRLKDLAYSMGVTPSYLSSIEAGRKLMPYVYITVITSLLGLEKEERDTLEQLVLKNKTHFDIYIKNPSYKKSLLVLKLIDKIDNLNSHNIERLNSALDPDISSFFDTKSRLVGDVTCDFTPLPFSVQHKEMFSGLYLNTLTNCNEEQDTEKREEQAIKENFERVKEVVKDLQNKNFQDKEVLEILTLCEKDIKKYGKED